MTEAGPSSEQKHVRNADFDRDVSSWQVVTDRPRPPGGGAVWSPLDARNRPDSGSLEIHTSATSDRDTFEVGQCFTPERPSEYVIFGGRMRVPPDQKARGQAGLSVEFFDAPDCKGRGNSQGPWPLANNGSWASVLDSAYIGKSRSVRLEASVTKQYDWAENDMTGQRDDRLLFQGFFDDLFLRFADEKDLPDPPQSPSAGLSTATTIREASTRWGKFDVQPPSLRLEAHDQAGKIFEEGRAVFSSRDAIALTARLHHAYPYDDPRRYPLEELSLAAENVSRGSVKPPTLEFILYRMDDPNRTPVEIVLSSSGEGGIEGDSTAHVSVREASRSEFRIRALRAVWGCLTTSLRALSTSPKPTPIPTPTDDQLFAHPFLSMMPATPPGDYELIGRYYAPAAGFWHEPVFSSPLRIRIVKKDFDCGPPKASPPR